MRILTIYVKRILRKPEAGRRYGLGVGMLTYLGYQTTRGILQDGAVDSPYAELARPKVPVPLTRGPCRSWASITAGSTERTGRRSEGVD